MHHSTQARTIRFCGQASFTTFINVVGSDLASENAYSSNYFKKEQKSGLMTEEVNAQVHLMWVTPVWLLHQ